MALTLISKNTSTPVLLTKIGSGWNYDDPNINYDDPDYLYDTKGLESTPTLVSKNTSTPTLINKS